MEDAMRRILFCCAVISLSVGVFALRAEERPLAIKVEHFFLISDRAQSLFTYFKDTFQLPEVWPFSQHKQFSSGGLSLGNAVLEFVKAEWEWPKDAKPLKTVFYGIAFEPTLDADATAVELTKAYLGLIEKLVPMVERGLSAAVYTQTTDVEIEVNGLMTYDRAVIKMDRERVSKANRSVRAFHFTGPK